jgi:endonuclease-3
MDAQHDLNVLKATHPNVHYYLVYDTPFHLLLATILSAQCTDVVVNKTTPALFARYQTPQDVVNSTEEEVLSFIKSITFSGAKAKHIVKSCYILLEKFHGEVPKEIDELTQLAGVGKKTANAIQQNAFGMVNGVIVDTHVIRVAQRLGWTKNKDPEKIEQDLMKLFPKAEWKTLPHYFKAHGQKICVAPTPKCSICPLNTTCPSSLTAPGTTH